MLTQSTEPQVHKITDLLKGRIVKLAEIKSAGTILHIHFIDDTIVEFGITGEHPPKLQAQACMTVPCKIIME